MFVKSIFSDTIFDLSSYFGNGETNDTEPENGVTFLLDDVVYNGETVTYTAGGE